MTDKQTASGAAVKKNSFHPDSLKTPGIAFVTGSILFLILLILNGFIGPDGNNMCRGDNFDQYIAFIEAFLRVLNGKQDLWYSFSLYAGSGSILTYVYYALSPFNVIYLIPGISIITATHIIAALKTGLSAAAFACYTENTHKTSRAASIFFSLAYAFCAWAVVMSMNCMWADSLYILPILLTVLIKFVTNPGKKKFLALTLCYAYLFLTNFYMGYIIGIFSFLSCITLIICSETGKNRIGSLKKMFTYALSVFLAAALDAALLLPAAYFLIKNLKGASDSFISLSATLPDIFSALYACNTQGLYSPTPYIYCGIPILIMIPFYFFSEEIPFIKKICAALILLFYLMGTTVLPVYAFLHAFDNPNNYPFRFSPCVVFLLVSMAAELWSGQKKIKTRSLWMLIAGLIAAYFFLVELSAITGIATVSNTCFFVNALFLLLWGIIYTGLQHNQNKIFRFLPYISLALLSAELLVSDSFSLRGFAGKNAENGPRIAHEEFQYWYDSESAAAKELAAMDNGFYRVRVNGEKCFNGASLFGLNTLTSFASFEKSDQRNAFSNLGIGNSYHMLFDISGTAPVDMLFSVKYFMDIPDSTENKPASVTMNDRALPIAYTVSSDLAYYSSGEDPFDNTNRLINSMTGQELAIYEAIPEDDIKTANYNTLVYALGQDTAFDMIAPNAGIGWVTYAVPVSANKTAYMYVTPLNITIFNAPAPYITRNSQIGLDCGLTIESGAIFEVDKTAEETGYNAPDTESDQYYCQTLYLSSSGYTSYAVDDIKFAYYDDDALTEAYNTLSQGGMQVTSFSDTRIEGTVTATEDRPLLFTSIPYEKGWQAYVDGVPSKIFVTVDDTFCTLVLSPGKHDIVFTYDPPQAFTGSIISTLAIIVILVIYISSNVIKSPKKNTDCEIQSDDGTDYPDGGTK